MFKYVAGADLEARCRVVYYDKENHREQHLRLLQQVGAMGDTELSRRADTLDVYELSDNSQMMGRPDDDELLPYYVAYEAVRRAVPGISSEADDEEVQRLYFLIRNAQGVQLAGGRVQTYTSPNNRHYCRSFLSLISEEVRDSLTQRSGSPTAYGPAPTPSPAATGA